MGTNYYVKSKACECCGRSDDDLHIGKSSGGWKFLFAPAPGKKSWQEWRLFLSDENVKIHNEYGDEIDFKHFCHMVESKQNDSMLDATTADADQYGPTPMSQRHKYEIADPEGYRFSTTDDFS